MFYRWRQREAPSKTKSDAIKVARGAHQRSLTLAHLNLPAGFKVGLVLKKGFSFVKHFILVAMMAKLKQFVPLLVLLALGEANGNEKVEIGREGKIFSIFSVVTFPNE